MPDEATTTADVESGERYDAKNSLAAWRMSKPEEFYSEVDALLAEVKAMPADAWDDAEVRNSLEDGSE